MRLIRSGISNRIFHAELLRFCHLSDEISGTIKLEGFYKRAQMPRIDIPADIRTVTMPAECD